MTRLEKLRNRARARIQDIGPDNALWLVARVDELAKVLQALNKESLGDFIYDVRSHECGSGEWEGDSWEGPRVTNWSKACEDLKTALATLDEKVSEPEEP